MAGTNDFQTFAAAGGANVLTQAQYLALQAKAAGFTSGIAPSAAFNKVWRQSSIISAMIGQFIADSANVNVVDDGTIATIEANFIAAIQAVNQVKLTAALNLYVNPSTGNDANNGLAPASAFRTIQAAFNAGYANYNYNRNSLVVNLAAGTYTAGVNLTGMPVGCPSVQLVGNVVTPASVQINVTSGSCIIANNGTTLSVSGVTLTATGTSTIITPLGYGVIASQAYIALSNCVIGSCGTVQITASIGSIIVVATCTFTGTSQFGLVAQDGGLLWANSTTLTFNAAVYSGATVSAVLAGTLSGVGTLFAGSATGQRYQATTNGIVQTNGGGANFWPGNSAGATSTGGLYV